MAGRLGRGTVRDAAAVALLMLAAVGSVPLTSLGAGSAPAPGARPGPGDGAAVALVWAICGLQVLATAAVPAQRRWPVGASTVVAAVVVAGLVPLAVTPSPWVEQFSTVNLWPPLALSGAVIAVRRHAPDRRAGALWLLVAVATVLAARAWRPSWAVTPVGLLHTAVPVLLGLYVAGRWQVLDALRARAAQSERERRYLTERARAEERARLAAELHDSVAHRVTLMVLQAGALRLTSSDEATRAAAEQLRATGCEALEELSDLLGVLRRPTDPEVDGPGLEDPGRDGREPGGPAAAPHPPADVGVADLVATSVAVGLPVTLTETGDASALPTVVRRTVYRVVQEALTNVHKHAPGAEVDVSVGYGGDQVGVRVRSRAAVPPTGRGLLPVTGAGTGLLGLRRRVEAIGGVLRAGQDGAGGFRVDATVPVRAPHRAAEPGPDRVAGRSGRP